MRGVAFVVPTMNRPERHRALYETFRRQTVKPKKLYVLDESKVPSPFFGKLRDPDVIYVQPKIAPRVDGVTRIGAARNLLNSLTREPVIVQFDDDDWYDETYAERMVERLGSAALAKLDVWRALHEPTGTVFEWDTRKMGGQHYAIRGVDVERVNVPPEDTKGDAGAAFQDAFRVGFGWSYVYPRSTWERHPFPEEGTEDIPWVRSIREAGGDIAFVSDMPHIALHTVHVDPNHPRGGSPHFPQRMIGKAGESAEGLRETLGGRMIGAVGTMQELPEGKPIRVIPGAEYSVLASVARSHSLKSLITRAAGWGVQVKDAVDNVPPEKYGVPAPKTSYRLVHVTATASKQAEMPWKVPSPMSAFDESSVVKAWQSSSDGRPLEAIGAGAPHRCTAASSSAIAKQIDPAWEYAGSQKPGTPIIMPNHRLVVHEATTPLGRRKIAARVSADGQSMILMCPYTAELFQFRRGGRATGVGASSYTLYGGNKYSLVLSAGLGGSPGLALNSTPFAGGSVSPPDANGYVTVTGTAPPGAPYKLPTAFSYNVQGQGGIGQTVYDYPVVTFTMIAPSCPNGQVWNFQKSTCEKAAVVFGPRPVPGSNSGGAIGGVNHAGGAITNPSGWSTGKKVAVGVGATAAVVLATYGAHRAGWI